MKRDFLKSLNLSDEVVDKIMAENGNDINGLKAKITELEGQVTDYKGQVSDRDKQLETLKKSSGDAESLKQQISKLQEENKAATEGYEAKIKQMAIDNAVNLALSNAKAKNAKAVRALLDLTNAQMDGETVKGLDKQIDKLKESDAYLFETETKPTVKGAKPAEGGAGNPQKPVSEMNYSERVAFLAAGGTLE